MNNTEIKTVELIVNSEQARKKLDELNYQLAHMKAKREQALERGDSKAIQAYAREMKKLETQINKTEASATVMSRVLGNLDKSTPNQLRQAITILNKEMNSGRVQRGSKEWQMLTKALKEAKTELQSVNNEIKVVKKSSFGDIISSWGNRWMGFVMNVQAALQAVTGIRHFMQQTVTDFANLEEAKAQVQKYTGLAKEEVDAVNVLLRQIDTRTPVEELNRLAGEAGKLGITATDQILNFVTAADRINVALGDDLGEDAVKNIGKLAMLFGEDKHLGLKKAMLSTASAINEISQNSSASAGYLEDFTSRVAGTAKAVKLSQAQIMGFAAVLDESMQHEETAATAFTNLLTKMYQEPVKFAKIAGQDVKQFTTLMRQDANQAVITFLQSLKGMGGFSQLAPMFEQMGLDGSRATNVLSVMADKLQNVKDMQLLANKAYSQAVSVNNEYAVQNNTVQAQLDKAKNDLRELSAELGEKLMPIAARLMSFSNLFLRVLSATLDWVGKHIKAIVTLTACIATYTAVLKFQVALEAVKNIHLKAQLASILSLVKATTLWRIATALYNVTVTAFTFGLKAARLELAALKVAMASNPIGILAVALTTVVGLLIQFTGLLDDETEAVEENTKALRGREKALKECEAAETEASDTYTEEAKRIERLQKIVHDNNRSIRERMWAIKELQKVAPDYNASLSEEGKLTEGNTGKIKEYLEQLKKKALAEALYDKLKEAMKEKARIDMALEIWDKAIATRQKNMDFVKRKYELPDIQNYDPTQLNPKAYAGSQIYNKNLNDLKLSKQRRDFWKQQQEVIDNEINAYFEYATSQAIDKEFENMIATSGKEAYIRTESTWKPKGSGRSGGRGGNTEEDRLRRELDKIEAKVRAKKNYYTQLTQQGKMTEEQLQIKSLYAEMDAVKKKQALYKKSSKEWQQLEESRLSLLQQKRDAYEKIAMEKIAKQEEQQKKLAEQEFLEGLISEEQYQQQLDRIKQDHILYRANYYRKYGNDQKADEYYNKFFAEGRSQQITIRKEDLRKAQQMQEEFFQQSLDEREQGELRLLDELVAAGVIAEERKEAFKEEIRKKYDKLREDEQEENDRKKGRKIENPLGEATGISADLVNVFKMLDSLQEKIKDGQDKWQDYAAVAVSSLAFVSSAISSVSQLFSAQQQEEEASVTRRYDAEIKKVGESSTQGKKLEEQKQKELAKVKNKYRKKQMAMEVAQAVLSTAQAAINAYASASKVSFVLGPIASAMALAAGAVQIAAIKKQHAAEQGYYSGGFTGGTDYRRRAGVVHEGEFVASHLAVRNPNVLPLLRLIDHAQRNNTIASLSAADVSRAIAAPVATAGNTAATAAAPALRVIDTASDETRDVLRRLNDNLEAGIHASVSITGEDGFERQWTRYNNMKNRK